MGSLLTALTHPQTESEFLFRPESKKEIERILEQMFQGLNTVGECSIPVGASTRRHRSPHAN